MKLKTLKNGEATRQAVVDAFRGHLGQAKKGDVALFYYSGHGSQEQAPEEFWKLEPDHLDVPSPRLGLKRRFGSGAQSNWFGTGSRGWSGRSVFESNC